MIKDETIEGFLDKLASDSATPGGGSAAAILGSMGAALISMISNLTIGKPKYKDVEEDLRKVVEKSEKLRGELLGMIEDDVAAFDAVMGAYGMPRDTDEQKAKRSEAIQSALKQATDVPLKCVEACRAVIELGEIASEKGNLNVISDAGVGVLSAYAGLRSAALNVYTNVKMIKDESFTKDRLSRLEKLVGTAESATEKSYDIVRKKLS